MSSSPATTEVDIITTGNGTSDVTLTDTFDNKVGNCTVCGDSHSCGSDHTCHYDCGCHKTYYCLNGDIDYCKCKSVTDNKCHNTLEESKVCSDTLGLTTLGLGTCWTLSLHC